MVGADRVRLIIPLRVVEELDKYRYEDRDKRIVKTARNLLPQLEKRLQANNFTKATVSDKLTIEVPIVPGARDRTLHADDEILQFCESVQQFGNQRLTLVTDDMPMRIQARARKLTTIGIEDRFRRSASDSQLPSDSSTASGDAQ
jgi:predicted ribonuclease YlaK